jgi:hypothetical protein
MQALGLQVTLNLAMCTLVVGPMLAAIWFLRRRKKRARQLRRSPLTHDLLRTPGHALREQLDDARNEMAFDLLILTVVPTFPLAYFQAETLLTGKLASPHIVAMMLVTAGIFVGSQIRKLLKTAEKMDRLRLGLDAEMAVGQELDQLMRDGAIFFHDLPADHFNIDHVVIARQGVYAIETKGYSKPNRSGGTADATAVFDGKTLSLPDRSGSRAIEQAQRQARWLGEWLKSCTGDVHHVAPVLALPGWYVERKGRGPVFAFSGRELRSQLLNARIAASLSPEQVQRAAFQVEQRCRTVEPFYKPDDGKV